MKVLKASAGSGKTYRLSHKYIDTLLDSQDADAYRHILAVTFTNKATAEMKGRILQDLYKASRTNPKAGEVLTAILHDYSSFAVSTIDKFFQQALKAFSRELGQFADYQIELDRDTLIQESVDRILDSLTEDQKELVDWIKASVDESLAAGEKFDIDGSVVEIGKRLKSEEFRTLSKKLGFDASVAYDKKALRQLRAQCREVIDDCTARIRELGGIVEPGKTIQPLGPRNYKENPELGDFLAGNVKRYNTAVLIYGMIYSLGLAGEFQREFDSLLKEKNLMCLDESNALLKDIIDGSDAPFVYEKLGVRYCNFLLDEFQDTSLLQWDNFLPLLRESESRGGDNLIVGDVKQSIYRWRNSDWTLLGSEVGKCFPDADVEPLNNNWRSTPAVVGFNNAFFAYASAKLGLSELYGDVAQAVANKDPQQGSVRITFTDNQLDEVFQSVILAHDAGAHWGEIAVLVRGHQEGLAVAEELIRRKIPVISDDSLNLKSSVVVRRLVSLLYAIDNPEDRINSYLAQSRGIELPDHYHSIVDLCEDLIRSLRSADPESFDGESVYVQAFMDDVHSWTELNGNNLRYYLKHWADSQMFIGTPENSESVRIMTIHKAKGLEVPYVIFPFADQVKIFRSETHWCERDGVLYPVDLTKKSVNTDFADDFEQERRKQLVDNLNLFYVAMTRAEKCLHVISKPVSGACRKAVENGKDHEWVTMSELLFAYERGLDDSFVGEPYDFGRMERKQKENGSPMSYAYTSYPLDGRLVPSTDASEFFGSEGVVGVKASPRLNGIWLHSILEHVNEPSDLRAAVDASLADGQYTSDEAEAAFELLESRIAAHPEWFDPDRAAKCFNEVSIIGADGREHRPDRVIVSLDGSVRIVDYKFGEQRDSYRWQVKKYAELYRKLGYDKVSASVWYVREDVTVSL